MAKFEEDTARIWQIKTGAKNHLDISYFITMRASRTRVWREKAFRDEFSTHCSRE
jgi:hypothetical protein